MYQATLTLILSLFMLHLTNRCWAQEPSLTTDTLEIVTPSLSSDGNIIDENITTDVISDSTTSTISEIATAPDFTSLEFISESPSSDLSSETTFDDLIFEPFPNCISLDPSLLDPNFAQSSDLIVETDSDIINDCGWFSFTWSGTDLTPPYRISYSTGTGELEDASILGDEIELDCTDEAIFWWSIPLTRGGEFDILPSYFPMLSFIYFMGKLTILIAPLGNVTRIMILDNDARVGTKCEHGPPHHSFEPKPDYLLP
jgi:hypothetical protein